MKRRAVRGSALWIDLRWSKATQLFTRIRSNAHGEGEWIRFDPPQANFAVAKRRAFELVARVAGPL
jgi:hypothetical protein